MGRHGQREFGFEGFGEGHHRRLFEGMHSMDL